MVAPVQTVRVLVVDDEEGIAQLLAGILRTEGHTADYVTDGRIALNRVRENRYDLLVTDLRMPEMDGMSLIEQAKEIQPDLDALIMTAFASTETAVDALRRGVTDYLSKPFGVTEIRTALGKVLDARSRRQDERRQVEALSARVESTEESLEERLEELTLLHDLARVMAGSRAPLPEALARIGRHFAADGVAIFEDGRVVESFGEGGRLGLRDLARRTTDSRRSQSMPGAVAAPLAAGALLVVRPSEFSQEERHLVDTVARDLGVTVENERLRSGQRRAYVGIVATLIEAIEAKDRFNRGHSRRVADLAVRFGCHLGLPERERELLETGAKLHDIGKIGIPEEILNKKGKLTDEEYEVIKSHPVISEQIIMPLEFLAEVRPIVRHHHERYDGGGYPDGLAGEDVPRAAAILSVVDAYDALVSDRPYRNGLPPARALQILDEGAGTQWDPELIREFRSL